MLRARGAVMRAFERHSFECAFARFTLADFAMRLQADCLMPYAIVSPFRVSDAQLRELPRRSMARRSADVSITKPCHDVAAASA